MNTDPSERSRPRFVNSYLRVRGGRLRGHLCIVCSAPAKMPLHWWNSTVIIVSHSRNILPAEKPCHCRPSNVGDGFILELERSKSLHRRRSASSARPSLGERGCVLSLPFPGNREHTWILPPTWCTQASDGSAEIDSPSEVGPPRRSWVRVSDPRSGNQRTPGADGL
ncbi:hypothetical protein NDU88_008440 [Pleurodeles waltl]|uniref:Uncharacterized protein n=1 Tax=Pleurodeles waltl TaxID=8319 RepID=A0AAV7N508_PLEWA|nr:hypothetical protein NDU88_008440 [Pleurodeles waltl]